MAEIYDIMNITCQNLYHMPYQLIPNPLASVSSKKCFDISGKPRTGAVIKVIFSFWNAVSQLKDNTVSLEESF
jgi:hypothetical protein